MVGGWGRSHKGQWTKGEESEKVMWQSAPLKDSSPSRVMSRGSFLSAGSTRALAQRIRRRPKLIRLELTGLDGGQ